MHNWRIEVCFIVVDARGLGEAPCDEACLVFDECAVLKFPVKDLSRGDDIRVSRTLHCSEDIQTAHRFDFKVHCGHPFICIGCIERLLD